MLVQTLWFKPSVSTIAERTQRLQRQSPKHQAGRTDLVKLLTAQQGHPFLGESGAAHYGTLESHETRYGRLPVDALVRASEERLKGAYLDRSPQWGVDGQEECGLVAAIFHLIVLTFGG